MKRLKILVLLVIVYSRTVLSFQWHRFPFPRMTPPQRQDFSGTSSSPLDVVNASNILGISLLHQLSTDGNLFFSPLGISLSMGMVFLGAQNHTAAEMSRILGYEKSGLNSEIVHPGFKQVMDMSKPSHGNKGEKEVYSLEVANAMLIDKNYEILPTFKEKIKKFYDVTIEEVNFSVDPLVALKSVNEWTAWKTKNKIKELLSEPLDPLTKLFLLNAIYFKGTWKTKFDQRWTGPDTFYNEGKIPTTVPMMRQKAKLKYGFVVYLQSQVLELPYDGNDIKMLILLPEKRDGLRELESKLTKTLIDQIPKNLNEVSVQVILPRFNLEEDYDLISIFKGMGLKALFDPDLADLSKMSSGKGLYVSKIVHKSVIDVNEEGSEAAAITGVAAGVRTGGALHPLFVADHPFIFFITDVRTNAILFVGRVNIL